ncbi:neutral/alkaline non-lysosomal ceramidase N-terminal domain-containing protein [Cryptosporangium sp. NPDC051539]|uniref:neutral/alkaline non-lysosomal ceramidase N-terminal domain-containing protein n=1 Tax=Cryptosporangium sp. NPDC051539 TaxID=3363962 RepID=UPI0037A69F94
MRFTLAAPATRPDPVRGLLAGAAEVDITPPPGLPKAGYSRNARTGVGFRGRLRARVLHLQAGAASLAIVQCDLLGGSAVLQRAVAAATGFPLAGLFVGATHTHGAPGQFLGTDLYNGFASNRPGFDPVWTRFLIQQLSAGVRQAVETRRPARLALGETEVWGLTRNRSLPAHVRNPVPDRRTAPQRAYAAVDPRLRLLRVDGTDGTRLAALVVFGVHGTGLPMRNSVYNADLWAYVYEEMRDRLGAGPVVGALQGTHADVAPALRPGRAGDVEAARVGRGIGAAASDLYTGLEPALRDDVTLGAGFREVDLSSMPRPALGAALIAGAYENETPVVHRIPPFRAGTPKPHSAADPHGAKWVLGSRWLQPVVMPQHRFPRVLPVQVLRIGSALLVGQPFEITVDAGRRVAAAVTAATGVHDVVVSSVANEYAGYCTTPEEYSRQHYEGGHTLYGPTTCEFLAAQAASLASLVGDGDVVTEAPIQRTFDLRVRRYWPESSGVSAGPRPAGAARFVDVTPEQDAFWEQGWYDAAPADLVWNEPIALVEWTPLGAGAWHLLVDDSSCAVEVRYRGPSHRYVVRWYAPDLRAGREYRFVVRGLPLRSFS